MAKGVDFFNSLEHLEPRCPKCGIKIDWGVNTKWCDKRTTQVCTECDTPLE